MGGDNIPDHSLDAEIHPLRGLELLGAFFLELSSFLE